MKVCPQCKYEYGDLRKACIACGLELVPAKDVPVKRGGFTPRTYGRETFTPAVDKAAAAPPRPPVHPDPPVQPPPVVQPPTPAAPAADAPPPDYRRPSRRTPRRGGVREWVRRQFTEHLMQSLAVIGFIISVFGVVLSVVGLPQVIYMFRRATNHVPAVRMIKASPHAIQVGGKVDLTAIVEDADGESLVPTWTSSAGRLHVNGMEATLSTDGMKVQSAPASITVSLTVTDAQVTSKPYDLTIPVSKSAPRLKMIRPDKMELSVGEPVTLIAVADDPDGGRDLRYEWSCPVGQIDKSNSYITTLQTAGLNIRSAPIFPKVTLTVTNEHGESVTGDVTLSISPKPRVYRSPKGKRVTPLKLVVNVVQPVNQNPQGSGAPASPVPKEQPPPPAAQPQKSATPASSTPGTQ